MKKITFLLMLLTAFYGTAQQVVVQDFEIPESFTFAGFEGLASASIVADPENGGTRGNTFRLVSQSTGNPWQGAEIVQTSTLLKLTTDKTVQIDVYSTQAFNLLAKVEVGTGPVSASSQSYTTPNAWQTLTFTFNEALDNTGIANGNYQKVVFFPNWNATDTGFDAPQNFTIYVDNITSEASEVEPEPEPVTAAPTPPARPAADVISIFSDAYTNIAVDTFDVPWCGATTTEVLIAGNPTKKVTGLGCEGVEWLGARPVDATGFTFFHMDIWTASATADKSFNVKLSNWAGGAGEANAIEFSVNNGNFLPSTNPGTWISLDIPIASFTPINGSSISDIVQFIITSDLGTVFYDNLYLHRGTTLSTDDFALANFKVYPNPSNLAWNVEATSTIKSINVVNILGKQVLNVEPNNPNFVINNSNLATGLYFATIATDNGSSVVKLIKN